jgi:hypothetical protein
MPRRQAASNKPEIGYTTRAVKWAGPARPWPIEPRYLLGTRLAQSNKQGPTWSDRPTNKFFHFFLIIITNWFNNYL